MYIKVKAMLLEQLTHFNSCISIARMPTALHDSRFYTNVLHCWIRFFFALPGNRRSNSIFLTRILVTAY